MIPASADAPTGQGTSQARVELQRFPDQFDRRRLALLALDHAQHLPIHCASVVEAALLGAIERPSAAAVGSVVLDIEIGLPRQKVIIVARVEPDDRL